MHRVRRPVCKADLFIRRFGGSLPFVESSLSALRTTPTSPHNALLLGKVENYPEGLEYQGSNPTPIIHVTGSTLYHVQGTLPVASPIKSINQSIKSVRGFDRRSPPNVNALCY